jgi:competence protein ComEC
MQFNVICFVAGVVWLQQQAELPAPSWTWVLATALFASAFTAPGNGRLHLVRAAILGAAWGVAGFALAAWSAHARLADALPAEWEARDISIVGVIASLPQADDRRVRFDFDVEGVMTPGASVPRRIVLSWWGPGADRDRSRPVARVRAGERWQLTVRLRRPRGTANPHGFDYEAWLLERGLRATGYVRWKRANIRLAATVHRPRYWVERARELARTRIDAALPDAAHAGVIAALVIGDQRAIPPEQWQVFTRTGVNHLMSISGLHVTMVSGLVFTLAYGLWRRQPALMMRVPARKAGTVAGLAAAFGYAMLSGFAVPAQRTVYMVAVVAAALWVGAVESAATVLALAVLVVVLLDPWAVLAPGFWLSFGAVAIIMYVSVGRIGRGHWLASFGRAQVAVTAALIPPLLAMFQQVSVVSLLANAFAIPIVSLLVVPVALVGTVMPFDFILQLAHAVAAGCLFVLGHLSELPIAVWAQHAPPLWTVVLAAGAVLLLLAPRGVPARWLGGAGLLPIFIVAPAPLETGVLQVAVLDVGHGVAVLVRTARHALLYDTGPSFGPRADSGSRIIVPYLRAAGVKRLDGLIVSHDDDDHAGGAASVLQALPVNWLMTSLPDLDPLVLTSEASFRCYAGQRWEWDGVRFEMLHPTRESYDDPRVKDNDRSCVLKIEAAGLRLLLPADIERPSELALLAANPAALRADVLLAPHQGSKTSSLPEFVAAVNARAVVFAVGYRNRFGHPHREVLGRYLERGSRVFRTDRDGALLIEAGPAGPAWITPYRAIRRRYWQTPFDADAVPDAQPL